MISINRYVTVVMTLEVIYVFLHPFIILSFFIDSYTFLCGAWMGGTFFKVVGIVWCEFYPFGGL